MKEANTTKVNHFNAEFLKWNCPALDLEESLVNCRNIKVKMLRLAASSIKPCQTV